MFNSDVSNCYKIEGKVLDLSEHIVLLDGNRSRPYNLALKKNNRCCPNKLNQIQLYLSYEPNTKCLDLTVKCLPTVQFKKS